MLGNSTNYRCNARGFDFNLNLPSMVWEDCNGKWHLSQATSEDVLVNSLVKSVRSKDGAYKIFKEHEYTEAVEYKKKMQLNRTSKSSIFRIFAD